jgi:hypothetical protein
MGGSGGGEGQMGEWGDAGWIWEVGSWLSEGSSEGVWGKGREVLGGNWTWSAGKVPTTPSQKP